MRNLDALPAPFYRSISRESIMGMEGDATMGIFLAPSPVDGKLLTVMATSGLGWDHVSVSRKYRCPTWEEMELVARAFFAEGETAMQLHVPSTDHVNNHSRCLHLWRPNDGREIPRPPAGLVGVKEMGVLT